MVLTHAGGVWPPIWAHPSPTSASSAPVAFPFNMLLLLIWETNEASILQTKVFLFSKYGSIFLKYTYA